MRFKCLVDPEDIKNQALQIERVVGRKRFLALQKSFGGQRIWIPKMGEEKHLYCRYCDVKNVCIRTAREGGVSVKQLAAMYGLSQKRIYNILNEELN